MKRYYLAGPMTGIPQFNFPQFQWAARRLRALGFPVMSPHELDPPDVQAAAWASPDGKLDDAGKIAGKTWGDILSHDVKLIADECLGVFVLPGWHLSRGARLEVFTALLCKLPVRDAITLVDLPKELLVNGLTREFVHTSGDPHEDHLVAG